MNLLKILFISLGTISLCFGIIGIFIPGLPTTPFLLLTAGFYVRSSDRLYHKLINNRFVGAYILEYRLNKGMTRKMKICAICIMWIMIAFSCLFFVRLFLVQLIILLAGITGTVVMGIIVPTSNQINRNN